MHEHTAFDGPDLHDTHQDEDHGPADGHGRGASWDGSQVHYHDSNHSMSAVGVDSPVSSPGPRLHAPLPVAAVVDPPHSTYSPLYRPPIA